MHWFYIPPSSLCIDPRTCIRAATAAAGSSQISVDVSTELMFGRPQTDYAKEMRMKPLYVPRRWVLSGMTHRQKTSSTTLQSFDVFVTTLPITEEISLV